MSVLSVITILLVLLQCNCFKFSFQQAKFGYTSSTRFQSNCCDEKSSSQLRLNTARGLTSSTYLLGTCLLTPAIAGGFLSGGLHAVSGPDHLAALLPPSIGRPGWRGMKIGATWGLGHGISTTGLGLAAYFLKGKLTKSFTALSRLSKFTEVIVGLSLLSIGFIGIKESREQGEEDHHDHEDNSRMSSTKAIFANGFLHGFSWDGAPSLAPAIAMTSWASALTFLLAYCFGTTAAMSMTAGAVGESSLRISKAFNNKTFARTVSLLSSVLALSVGLFWIAQALIFG